METQFPKALEGVANIVANKWYAAMGLVGLIAFVTSLFVELPTDRTATTCVSLMLMGWGFGQTECRTFRQRIRGYHKVTSPVWRLTVTGAMMLAIAVGAAAWLVYHLWVQAKV